MSFLGHFSGLQIYYLSSTSVDGTDDYCEQLGWNRLQEYNPAQRCWKYLSSLAEGDVGEENNLPFEDDLEEEDYYPSLPFAALFSCFKVQIWTRNEHITYFNGCFLVLYSLIYFCILSCDLMFHCFCLTSSAFWFVFPNHYLNVCIYTSLWRYDLYILCRFPLHISYGDPLTSN